MVDGAVGAAGLHGVHHQGEEVEQKFVTGHMRYKYLESRKMKMPQLNYISDVTVLFDPG